MSEPVWMVRKADFRILRPMPQPQLIEMIETGQLLPQDEVCSASGYWFSLQDAEEVRAHLGDVKLNSLVHHGVEITSSTDTDPLPKTKLIQPVLASPKLKPSEASRMVFSQQPVQPESDEDLVSHRKKAWLVVLAAFGVFLFLLISIWTGTH